MSFGSFLQDRHLRGAASCGSQSPLRRDVRWADKLQLVGVLEAHGGCVNAVRWSAAGDLLVSGSDDRRCCVWSAAGALLATRNTRHHRNIFDACFVPDGAARIVTCAADGCVGLTQGVDGPNIGAALLYASPQAGCIASKLSFLPTQPEVFLAAFSDGKIRLFDLRLNTRGRERVVLDLDGVGATAVEFKPRSDVVFAVGADDVQLRVCDLRRAGDSDQAAAWTDDGHAATATMRDGAAATMRDGAATATRADAGAPATTSRPLRQDWTRDANRPAAADASEAWEDSEDSDDSEDSSSDEGSEGSSRRLMWGLAREGVDESEEDESEVNLSEDTDDFQDGGLRTSITRAAAAALRPRRALEARVSGFYVDPALDAAPNARRAGTRAGRLVRRADIGISGVSWSRDGRSLLANYRGADLALFREGGNSLAFARSFRGRRNVETCAKEARWLFGDAVVATGGDDGALYLWDAETAAPLSKRRADRCVVNSIAPHPFDLGLATSGIDSEVKLWEASAPPSAETRRRAESSSSSQGQLLGESAVAEALDDAALDDSPGSASSVPGSFRGSSAPWSPPRALRRVAQVTPPTRGPARSFDETENAMDSSSSSDGGGWAGAEWDRRLAERPRSVTHREARAALRRASLLRLEAADLAGRGAWSAAAHAYDAARDETRFAPPSLDIAAARDALRSRCDVSRAALFLRDRDALAAQALCGRVLRRDAGHAGARRGRALARRALGDGAGAFEDACIALRGHAGDAECAAIVRLYCAPGPRHRAAPRASQRLLDRLAAAQTEPRRRANTE